VIEPASGSRRSRDQRLTHPAPSGSFMPDTISRTVLSLRLRSPLACAAPLLAATLLALPLGASAQSIGSGKLLLTGGVTSIDGAAGGGLTPWAVTGSYATEDQFGATAFFTRSTTQNYALNAYGAAVAYGDRVEVSLARQEFNAGVVVPGTTLRLDILGLKARVAGNAVLDSDSLMPQIALGAEFKHVDPGATVGGILDGAGVKRSGVDLYLSATKLLLAQSVLLNGTLRATKANQNGLLGFGSADKGSYSLEPEFSAAYLLQKNLAIGAEYRFKPNNLAFAGAPFAEDDWKDLFVAWALNKHVSVTAAYVDLGNIVGHDHQHGAYLSLQFAL
jgi:hypothetical protein